MNKEKVINFPVDYPQLGIGFFHANTPEGFIAYHEVEPFKKKKGPVRGKLCVVKVDRVTEMEIVDGVLWVTTKEDSEAIRLIGEDAYSFGVWDAKKFIADYDRQVQRWFRSS